MSRIDEALARLDAAVARVEQAAANAGTEPEMAVELHRARKDYAALKGKTDGVVQRLDTAIGRLNGILGEAAE